MLRPHIDAPIIYGMAKTTLEIPDPLLRDAKKLAASEGTTLHALVEQGLRMVVADRERRDRPFRLRKVSFAGQGLDPELAEAGWDRIRERSYGDRGG